MELLQRTDFLAVGMLAGPLSALEDLLREAGPQYRYQCPPSGCGELRPALLYNETRLKPGGLVGLVMRPGLADPYPYRVEFVQSCPTEPR